MHQPFGAAKLRQRLRRGTGLDGALCQGSARGAQEDRHDLPALQPDAVAHGGRKRRLPAQGKRPEQGGYPEEGHDAFGARRHRRQGGRLPQPALRRTEAARRHRPRPCQRPTGASVRRGDLRARPADNEGDPAPSQAPQRNARHHDRAHHARDGCRQGDL